MSVKVEKLSGCKVKLSFVAEAEAFDVALDKAFEKKVKDVKVDGFRPGKLPKDIYMKRFGEASLYDEVIDQIVNEEFAKAVTSKKLEVVGRPNLDVDFETLGHGKKLKFTIEVEVWPDVTLGEYKGIEVEKEKVEVKDEDVEEDINRTLKNYAELEVVEGGKLEKGQTAVFDFEGFVDGVAFEGGKAENYSLEIGSGQFIPGFEDQMVGMEAGTEKDINVKFPDEYQAENLKGKDATFHIKLHEIKKRVIPALDEAFVKELEIENIGTVEDYRNFVKEKLLKDRSEAAENKLNDDILTKAVDNATVEIPEALVEEEVNRNFRQVENQAKMYKMPVEQLLKYYGIDSVEAYKEALKPGATANVKQRIVFGEIAKVEKLKVSDKDYQKELDLIVKEVDKPLEEVKKVYTKEALTPYILMQKAMDLIKKEAIVK